ncbi:hypothetical protein [Phyllobacterium phragmitis]|nr:hypothetical protein [Phyllobacterium phragmitis]
MAIRTAFIKRPLREKCMHMSTLTTAARRRTEGIAKEALAHIGQAI